MSFGVYDVPFAAPLVLALWVAFCLLLVVQGRTYGLTVAVVVVGAAQWPLIAYLGDLRLQWMTEVAALSLFLLCAIQQRRQLLRPRVLLVGAAVLLFLGLQTLRASSLHEGAFSLRAMLYPLLFTGLGILLFRTLDWRRFGRFLAVATAVVIVYMLVEKILGVPLVDPSPTELALYDPDCGLLRENLPSAYLADGITAVPWFRPGGPFFNPPIAGIFIGAGVYAALRWLRPVAAAAIAVAGVAAVALTVARAGLLMVVVVALAPFAVRLLGRYLSAAFFAVGGVLATFIFVEQGATASHGLGLIEGTRWALTHPWGSGIGTQGFFANGQALEVNESWLGVVFASTGVIPLVVVVALLVWIVRNLWLRGTSVRFLDVYPLAVVMVAGLSESVSALRGTPAMWLLLGEALAFIAWGAPAHSAATEASRRVLWIARDLTFVGGAERVASLLARQLSTDLDVTLVSVESRVPAAADGDGVVYLRSGLPFGDLELARPITGMPLGSAVALAVRRRALRFLLARRLRALVDGDPAAVPVINHNVILRGALSPDAERRAVLHMHASVAEVASQLARPQGTGLRALNARSRRAEARRLLRLARTCRVVVCTSTDEAEDMAVLTGREVQAIRNPLPWSPRQRGSGRAVPESPLLYVGRLAPEKRPDLAVRVLAELRKRGHGTTLRVIGGGPESSTVRALAGELAVEPFVAFAGERVVDEGTYQAGCVLLVPSDFEASPMVLVEATSLGVPCVATDVGRGVEWIAERTGSVTVVPRGDIGAMADAVEGWWEESEGAAAERAATARAGLAELSVDAVSAEWRELLRTRATTGVADDDRAATAAGSRG